MHRSQQISSESIHRGELAARSVSCDACLEENSNCKVCKCDHKGTSDSKEALSNGGGNCSFAHAVINMVAMLIGESTHLMQTFIEKFQIFAFGKNKINLFER